MKHHRVALRLDAHRDRDSLLFPCHDLVRDPDHPDDHPGCSEQSWPTWLESLFSRGRTELYTRLWIPTVVSLINILRAAFAPIFLPQRLQSQTVIRKKLRKARLCQKVTCKMLMKLTPG